MKYGHYQPQGDVELCLGGDAQVHVYLATKEFDARSRIIAPAEWADQYPSLPVIPLGSIHDFNSIMKTLYATLRQMDDEQVETIYLVAHPSWPESLLDRMKKAANHHVKTFENEA